MGLIAELQQWYYSNPTENGRTATLIISLLQRRTPQELQEVEENPQQFLNEVTDALKRISTGLNSQTEPATKKRKKEDS